MWPLGLRAAHEHLAEVPILVLANKKDLRDAMSASELTTALALTDVKVRACQTDQSVVHPLCCLASQLVRLTQAAGTLLRHQWNPDAATAAPQVDWHMQATCATAGEGLKEGLDWIAQQLQGDKAPPRRVMR